MVIFPPPLLVTSATIELLLSRLIRPASILILPPSLLALWLFTSIVPRSIRFIVLAIILIVPFSPLLGPKVAVVILARSLTSKELVLIIKSPHSLLLLVQLQQISRYEISGVQQQQ